MLASRSEKWREQRDERRFRKRVAFWSLTETTRVRMLSGAVMAVRAADFDLLGGFDERFPLYFEETDFLRRVSEHRKRIAYVPAAKVRHVYNQSASHDSGAAAARYAESEWKYLEKWCGPWLARALKRAERGGQAILPVRVLEDRQDCLSSTCVTEASPLRDFETAAGFFGFAEDVPAEVKASLNGSPLYLRYKIRP